MNKSDNDEDTQGWRMGLGLLLWIIVLSTTSPICSSSIIKLPSKRDMISGNRKVGVDDGTYCHSWRLCVENNDAGKWQQSPARCEPFLEEYMNGERYVWDSQVVADFSLAFANQTALEGDGRDAWVFDVDETLLSNWPFYSIHGFGSKKSNETWFEEWVNSGEAKALASSMRLYNHLQHLGFKIFLLTGRHEDLRAATEANLLSAGYRNWDRLIMRGSEDHAKTAKKYKSQKRALLMIEGYIIHGNSGDQWSDLLGFPIATRSFKLPNPLYYIE